MNILSFIRYLQGERPGMSAGGKFPPVRLAILYPTISIHTDLRLVDVSYYQGSIDFNAMRAAGIAGTIIRAGQRTWVDTRFAENWQKAKAAGVPRGSYWLYDSREDPRRQAALWWAQIKDDAGELVHVADLEENYGGAYGTKAHMKEFITEFQRLSRLPDSRIVIYTSFYWFSERVGSDLFFADYRLWLAWYAEMGVVRVPGPWEEEDILFWQYTSHGDGTLYGVSSLNIDLNYYCCNLASFNSYFGVSVTLPAPPVGGPMWYRVNATSGLNIRRGPGTSYQDIGDLQHGDLVEVVEPSLGGWVNIFSVMRGGTVIDVPVPGDSWCKDSYLVAVSAPVPPEPEPEPVPPAGLPDLPVSITLGDDVTYAKQTLTTTLKPK